MICLVLEEAESHRLTLQIPADLVVGIGPAGKKTVDPSGSRD